MMNMIIATAVTFCIYLVAKKAYKKWSYPFLAPLFVSPIVLIILIKILNISADTYIADTKWISDMLGPATVAFAVPIYKHFHLLKKYIGIIVISITAGTLIAIISSFSLALAGNLNLELILSLLPRSITTPIAIEVSKEIGGLPALTTLFVIVTGITGSIFGPVIMKWLSIKSPIAKGLALGMGAHGSGTAAALEYGEKEATFSTIALILAAWFTLLWGNSLIPALMSMIQ